MKKSKKNPRKKNTKMEPENTQQSASSFNENDTTQPSQELIGRPSSPVYHPSSDLGTRLPPPSSELPLTSPQVKKKRNLYIYAFSFLLDTLLAYPNSSELNSRGAQLPSSQQTFTLPNSLKRAKRGDVTSSRVLDNFIASQGSEKTVEPMPLTSDPAAVKRVIWGTNVDVTETMMMFKDFLNNFKQLDKKMYLKEEDMEILEQDNMLFYPHYVAQVIQNSLFNVF